MSLITILNGFLVSEMFPDRKLLFCRNEFANDYIHVIFSRDIITPFSSIDRGGCGLHSELSNPSVVQKDISIHSLKKRSEKDTRIQCCVHLRK